MKSPYPLIEVRWLDAETDNGWEFTDDAPVEIPEVMTVGFLIKESPDGIMVASTVCAAKSTNARMTIPRGMIKSLRYLRGKPKDDNPKPVQPPGSSGSGAAHHHPDA